MFYRLLHTPRIGNNLFIPVFNLYMIIYKPDKVLFVRAFSEATINDVILIGVLKNYAKFTGKHLSQSVNVNKVACWWLINWCFLVSFVKFLRTLILQSTSGRLLLHFTGYMIH